jgi:hypothetical protein
LTRPSSHAIFNMVLPEWRNWQTQQTQNLPGITPRVGSTPSSGTIFFSFGTFCLLTPYPFRRLLPLRRSMSSLSSNLEPMNNRRRSQRVLLRIPISVIAQAPDKTFAREETHTHVVSAHGALIHLKLKVRLGQVIIIKNPETSEEQSCRVCHLSPLSEGNAEIGIEFVKPAPKFWRVAFPPSDWNPQSPDITSGSF